VGISIFRALTDARLDAARGISIVRCIAGVAFLFYVLLHLLSDSKRGVPKTANHKSRRRVLPFGNKNRENDMHSASNFPSRAPKHEKSRARKTVSRWPLAILLLLLVPSVRAQDPSKSQDSETNAQLRQELDALRSQVAALTVRLNEMEKSSAGSPAEPASSAAPASPPEIRIAIPASTPTSQAVNAFQGSATEPGSFLRDTTFNVLLDGYYEYNFNSPAGRVNLLRPYDVSSNSFSLNQAAIVIEHAPNLEEGRRFGARVDLQYGQATETLQGSAANELRPQVYRNLFQVYGTYVAPVGSGLTIDFGKWASSLGLEGNYTKDQFNYSRSYFFNFLPFYHMGFRAGYDLTSKVNLTYWLVNGAQQLEDFNGFKSQAFIFTLKPASTVSWNVNYYFGQEQRDVVAVLNPGLPTEPTQPGLPAVPIIPTPDGREHIFDTYLSWNATPKLTFAGEFDYVINRYFSTSPPGHVIGGALYGHRQLTPRTAVSARTEYLSDRGGLFSGTTQALKETTLTFDYKLADGFLARWDWRRDFSNQPFFLTSRTGVLSNNQNTASLGLVWWFGQKQGSW
jgi:hypothetical protein